MAFGWARGTLVCVIGRHDPGDAEWRLYLDSIRRNLVPELKPRSLVYSEGGAPTASQRKELTALLDPWKDRTRSAVLTASAIARGVMTALHWFIPIFRGFKPTQIAEAMRFLELPDDAKADVEALLTQLRRQLGDEASPSASL